MVRWLPRRSVVVHILLLSISLAGVRPALCVEPTDSEQKIRIVTEDPIFDGFFRKRLDAMTKEEQEPEELAFLVIGLVTGGFAIGTYRSFISSAPFKALKDRRDLKSQLIAKLTEKERWEKHDHDIVNKLVAARKTIAELREKIASEGDKGARKRLEADLRNHVENLSKLAGSLEQSPSECVKLLAYVAELDEIDNKLEAALKNMEKVATQIHKDHGRSLGRAIEEWGQGKGLYAIEEWLRNTDHQVLNSAKMKEAIAHYTEVQKEASALVQKTIPYYNTIADKRNLEIRQRRSRIRELPIIRRIPLLGQMAQAELNLYDYRKSETGHDTRNFDQSDSLHRPTGKTISRSDLVQASKDQCALGLEQMSSDVNSLRFSSSLPWTFRTQITMGGITGTGAYALSHINAHWKEKHGKNIWQSRAEGIRAGKRVDAASNHLSAQMTEDDSKNGTRQLTPLYDATAEALLKKMPHIAAQVEERIKEMPPEMAKVKLAEFDKLRPFFEKKQYIRNSVANAAFQVVSEQRMADLQQFVALIRTKDEGELLTLTTDQVNLLVDATLRKFFSGISVDVKQLLNNDGTLDIIRVEVIDSLRNVNRGTPVSPDSTLPIPSLPGVKPETASKPAVKADPLQEPKRPTLNEQAATENSIPLGSLVSIQAAVSTGQQNLSTVGPSQDNKGGTVLGH